MRAPQGAPVGGRGTCTQCPISYAPVCELVKRGLLPLVIILVQCFNTLTLTLIRVHCTLYMRHETCTSMYTAQCTLYDIHYSLDTYTLYIVNGTHLHFITYVIRLKAFRYIGKYKFVSWIHPFPYSINTLLLQSFFFFFGGGCLVLLSNI